MIHLDRLRNSLLVLGSSRKLPNMQEVMVLLLIFWTPRMTMHMCEASMTTPTPVGSIASTMAIAISRVSLS